MRVKSTLLLILMTCVASISMAQQYAEDYIIPKNGVKPHRQVEMIYGVMVGTIFPKMSDKQDLMNISNKAGFAVGMMWGVDLGSVEVVPEFWYTHANTTLTVLSDDESYDMVTQSIEVPIIFAIPFGESGLRFNVGPTFALMSNSKLKVEGDEDIDFGRTKSTAGYLIGASYTAMEHWIFDFRFTGRYVSTEKQWYKGQEMYDYRNYMFGLNVGYRF